MGYEKELAKKKAYFSLELCKHKFWMKNKTKNDQLDSRYCLNLKELRYSRSRGIFVINYSNALYKEARKLVLY